MKELIYHIRKSMLVPEGPEELSAKQFIELAGILHSEKNNLKKSFHALRVFLGTSWFSWFWLSAEWKLKAIPHIDWIFEDWTTTTQLLPSYDGFFGPSDKLMNLTLSEFHFAELFYADLVENQGVEALNNLIAVLYRVPKRNYDRKKNLDGDVREAFNSNATKYYSWIIERWPEKVKFAILIFYDGCRKYIQEENPKIFGESSGGDGDGQDLGLFGVMRGLAGPKYGKFEDVEKMYLYTALLEINLLMEEEEKLKSKTPTT